jgi:hypothetical protein
MQPEALRQSNQYSRAKPLLPNPAAALKFPALLW